MEPDFYARKTYHAGRWYVRADRGVWSVPAYVSPPFQRGGTRTPRVSMRGPMFRHSER